MNLLYNSTFAVKINIKYNMIIENKNKIYKYLSKIYKNPKMVFLYQEIVDTGQIYLNFKIRIF